MADSNLSEKMAALTLSPAERLPAELKLQIFEYVAAPKYVWPRDPPDHYLLNLALVNKSWHKVFVDNKQRLQTLVVYRRFPFNDTWLLTIYQLGLAIDQDGRTEPLTEEEVEKIIRDVMNDKFELRKGFSDIMAGMLDIPLCDPVWQPANEPRWKHFVYYPSVCHFLQETWELPKRSIEVVEEDYEYTQEFILLPKTESLRKTLYEWLHITEEPTDDHSNRWPTVLGKKDYWMPELGGRYVPPDNWWGFVMSELPAMVAIRCMMFGVEGDGRKKDREMFEKVIKKRLEEGKGVINPEPRKSGYEYDGDADGW